ncbi:MAG: 5-formyltetrahydrofolate cyclo-ligase [Candidatus Nitrosotenuis sp.]|nr:5-formyltetrahydrofolate cyclo-ligase [Candidatus Nitrosotenuis sp.]
MSDDKPRLRNHLLEKRDGLSHDFMTIASKQIQRNLKKIETFRNAEKVACYYSVGSEVRTLDIIQQMISEGRTVALPRVIDEDLVFCAVKNFEELQKGEFGIMEPRKNCPIVEDFDVILVPAVAMMRTGQRLGYGRGYYDRFLSKHKTPTIALEYSRLVVRNIPKSEGDIPIHWVVTEDEVVKTSKV